MHSAFPNPDAAPVTKALFDGYVLVSLYFIVCFCALYTLKNYLTEFHGDVRGGALRI